MEWLSERSRNMGYAMMLDAHFSLEAQGLFWTEAMNAATSLVNIMATSTRDVCAYESYYGKKPVVYDNLQPFGADWLCYQAGEAAKEVHR